MADYRNRLKLLVREQTALFNNPNATEDQRMKKFSEIQKVQAARDKDRGHHDD